MSIFLRTFEFHPVPSSKVPTSDENSTATAGHQNMTVLCQFWSQAFSLFSNVDPCTIQCPDKQQIHLTQPKPSIKYGNLREIATCFQCFARSKITITTSGDQEDIVSVSKIGFDAPLLSHFLWRGRTRQSSLYLKIGFDAPLLSHFLLQDIVSPSLPENRIINSTCNNSNA